SSRVELHRCKSPSGCSLYDANVIALKMKEDQPTRFRRDGTITPSFPLFGIGANRCHPRIATEVILCDFFRGCGKSRNRVVIREPRIRTTGHIGHTARAESDKVAVATTTIPHISVRIEVEDVEIPRYLLRVRRSRDFSLRLFFRDLEHMKR